MRPPLIRRWLPRFGRVPLWGDREQWGLIVQPDDICWREWQKTYADFYMMNQRNGIGMRVNDAGYRVMRQVKLNGKTVLEIGPGDIRHCEFWQGQPSEYVLADIQQAMLDKAEHKLGEKKIKHRSILLERGTPLPFDDASLDIVVSFYSLEHIYPLQPYLNEIFRVLKPNGNLIGAIPAEGGLAWGMGRLFTSRRWLKKNTYINPDKLICWEHPNFADEILSALDNVFDRQSVSWWPFSWLPWLDVNLIIRYMYVKRV